MKLLIANDHGGFPLKEEIAQYLKQNNISFDDLGTQDASSVDYPDFAQKVASEISAGRADRGILVCGTGVGMAIAANKFKNVRAHAIGDLFSARMSREHNDLNVLCLGGRVIGVEVAKEIVKIFLETPFAGGRHAERVKKIHVPEK